MKKMLLFTILLLVIFSSLSCNNKKEDEYITFMISYGIESYVDELEPANQLIETNFGVFNAQYIETIKDYYLYAGKAKEYKVVIDEKEYEITVDKNNKIVSLSLRSKLEPSTQAKEISEEEAIRIAKDYMNKYDVDINEYDISSSYGDNIWNSYVITFNKKGYNNYSNGDQIMFGIDLYGNLKNIHCSFFGLIPTDAGQIFDRDKVASCAIDFAYNRYQAYKAGYELSFKIDEMKIICLDENEFAVQANVITYMKPYGMKYLDYIIVKMK